MVAGLGVGLAVGLLMGLSVGLEQALVMGLVLGVGMGVALGIGHGLVRPMSDRELVGPNATLREDRTSSFVSMLIIGLSVGISVGFVSGLLAGLVAGIATGLAIVLNSAWFRFTASTAWLSVRGLLPWQLMFFLEDANRRGVLRQVGAVYQFRHVLLQDYLANSGSSESKVRSSS
jgi:MFS family permease